MSTIKTGTGAKNAANAAQASLVDPTSLPAEHVAGSQAEATSMFAQYVVLAQLRKAVAASGRLLDPTMTISELLALCGGREAALEKATGYRATSDFPSLAGVSYAKAAGELGARVTKAGDRNKLVKSVVTDLEEHDRIARATGG